MAIKEIKEGNKAPDFTALDQDGKKVKLYQVFQIINLEIFLRKVNEI